MMAAISKGDTIQTIGGIIGRIVELKPDTALLEVDRNSNSRMAISRAAIQQVVEKTGAKSEKLSNVNAVSPADKQTTTNKELEVNFEYYF